MVGRPQMHRRIQQMEGRPRPVSVPLGSQPSYFRQL